MNNVYFNSKHQKSWVKVTQNINGFGLIESLIALALLAAVTVGVITLNNDIQQKNAARELAVQTKSFAGVFAKYLHDNYDKLSGQWQVAPLTLNSYMLGEFWAVDTAKQNFYRQTPCVTIVKNQITGGEEALMYYVGGQNITSGEIARLALVHLGRSGGILLGSWIHGNSGWGISNSSSFLANAAKCGGAISNNSIAVKLDLLEEWNQSLQPVIAINRGLDKGTDDIKTLPGHMLNSNTAKSNIYFAENKGVILDNFGGKLKLHVRYNGTGNGAATLGLGSTTMSSLIADTIQPNLFGRAGDACNFEEIGKIIVDQGMSSGDALAQSLSRNTLVCTRNTMLCAHANSTCYLSSLANKITFRNLAVGIQNASGRFLCPASVPFLEKAEIGLINSNNQVPIYTTVGRFRQGDPKNIICSGIYGGEDIKFCHDSGNIFVIRPVAIVNPSLPNFMVRLDNIKPGVGLAIRGALNGYTTNIGYEISQGSPIDMKSFLNTAFNQYMQVLGGQIECRRAEEIANFQDKYTGINYQHLSCYRLQTVSPSLVIAVRSDDPSLRNITIIKQATCSNMPLYVQN